MTQHTSPEITESQALSLADEIFSRVRSLDGLKRLAARAKQETPMTTEQHSPELLIENADHGIAFEVACASALTRLLAKNAELQQQLEAIGAGGVEPLMSRQPLEPAYLLRDLAADIGVNALDLIAAIRDAGLGNYSINMMLPAKVCVAMCQRFAAVEQEPEAWRLRNTAFRSEVYEYFKKKFQAESRQMQFNMSCDEGGLHGLTPLYTRPQPKREDMLLQVIQRLNQNPYSLTKWECIDLIEAMRANGIGGEV